MPYQPIENYGVIGDLYTVALVGMDGSIDFLCFPQFDSPSVFAALLGDDNGGRFQLSPALDGARQKQLYLPDTAVLLTRTLSDAGVAEVSDFMPVEDAGVAHNLVRRAKTVRGEIRYRMVCDPRFDYGRAEKRVELVSPREALFRSFGADGTVLRLRSEVDLRLVEGAAVAEFVLRGGETAAFVLESAEPGAPSPSIDPDYVGESFKRTCNFWRRWLSRSRYQGRWREMVDRSALTLKLLTSAAHGSMVAAPTFGLPESIGGVRNWDYRFTWIRDTSFALSALTRLGFTEEAAGFMRWFEARCEEMGPDGSLQILYGIDGRHDTPEIALDHLEGYRGSRPVRVGNAARGQVQLDIYGELLDAILLFEGHHNPISHDLWKNLLRLIDGVCRRWNEPDEGIWEVRSGGHEFLYSRVMCWVAVDRAIRLAQRRSLPAPLSRWYETRDLIHQDVHQHFWDEKKRAFTQQKGSPALDASTLLMPMVGFISPVDPRWLSTLEAIGRELVSDSLVFRYRQDQTTDGLVGDEGTFGMCSFWYVEALARAGNVEKARYYFEKMLGYANHLGLYAEEMGPCGEHLGNFPQAFTHVGLIGAAFALDEAMRAERGG